MNSLAYLFSLERLGMKFGLETMRALCDALGHPERAFRSIIVAGTNGKGSVTAMVEHALRAAGIRTARYTSPHLERIEERFVIGGREVDTDDLRAAIATVRATIERLVADGTLAGPPTFFECATAVAFELFREAAIDVAVLEVGLGGRLDATNVVTPVLSVITSVDLDHQAQLGDTIESIAREKAGVIKPGRPVVCGPVGARARAVIAEVSAAQDAPLVSVEESVRLTIEEAGEQTTVSLESERHRFEYIPLALRGRHQARNAATTVCVLETLASAGIDAGRAGILEGLTHTHWPGRLELVRWRGADVLIDAAHNPAGLAALDEYLADAGWSGVTIVVGAMRDKDLTGMLSVLSRRCRRLICTTAPTERAAPATTLATLAQGLQNRPPVIEAIDDATVALTQACRASKRVVVAGSIFLIGRVRGILR